MTLLPELAAMPGHLLWRAAARVQAVIGTTLPAEVDVKGYAALLGLADGVPRTQQALADTVGVSRTTMATIAARLVDQGLVERIRNPSDRRSYALTRTEAGREAADRWHAPTQELEDAVTAGLTAAETDELRDLLHTLAAPGLAEDTPEQVRHSTGFLITRVHLRMHREFLAALEPLGIEPHHFGMLAALRATGPISQAEAARHFGVSGARVVALVDELEERGLVERRRAPQDRRTQLLHLRPAAQRVMERAVPLADEVATGRLDPLPAADRERLITLLARFVTAP